MTESTELFEQLAATQHEIWASWERYLHSKCYRVWVSGAQVFMVGADGISVGMQGGELVIPAELVKRWERQMGAPYGELTPAEQVSDREQVLKFWQLLNDFGARWLAERGYGPNNFDRDDLVAEWVAEFEEIAWEFCPSCGLTVHKSSIEAGHRPDCSLVPRLGSAGDGD